jgi:hypothetical protein
MVVATTAFTIAATANRTDKIAGSPDPEITTIGFVVTRPDRHALVVDVTASRDNASRERDRAQPDQGELRPTFE